MLLPYHPRWLNRFVAWMFGFFWLPCPICGKNFGGHEWSHTLMISEVRGQGVCPMCVDEAAKRNIEFLNKNIKPNAPGGYILVDGELTDEQFDRLKKAWEERYTGKGSH